MIKPDVIAFRHLNDNDLKAKMKKTIILSISAIISYNNLKNLRK